MFTRSRQLLNLDQPLVVLQPSVATYPNFVWLLLLLYRYLLLMVHSFALKSFLLLVLLLSLLHYVHLVVLLLSLLLCFPLDFLLLTLLLYLPIVVLLEHPIASNLGWHPVDSQHLPWCKIFDMHSAVPNLKI